MILDEPTSGLDTVAVVLGTGAEHEERAWQVGLKCQLERLPLMRSGRVTSLPDADDQRATAHIVKMALNLVIGYMRFAKFA